MRATFAAGLAGFVLFGQAVIAAPPDLAAAAATLAAHSDGAYLDRKPGAVAAFDGLWNAVQTWAVTTLNAHPDLSAAALTAAAPKGKVAITATALGNGAFVIAAAQDQIGNVFLAGRDDHGGTPHFAKLWDIRDSEATPLGWRAQGAQNQCDKCRALSGAVIVLPADMSGRRRFLVDAAFAQPAGATHAKQISIWNFSGKTVRAMYQKTYISLQDDGWDIAVTGSTITVPVKAQYRTFMACGACDGRKLMWTLKLGYDLVTDAGQVPVVPEMDTVDEVFWRVWHHLPVSEIASPQVIQFAERVTAAAGKPSGDASLGLLSTVTRKHQGATTEITLETDNPTLPVMRFTVIEKNGGPYLSHVMNPNGG